MVSQSYEGSWEELSRHAAEFAGRRFRLTPLTDNKSSNGNSNEPTLDKVLAGYVGAIKSGTPHDDAKRAEEIWGAHLEEKNRKRG